MLYDGDGAQVPRGTSNKLEPTTTHRVRKVNRLLPLGPTHPLSVSQNEVCSDGFTSNISLLSRVLWSGFGRSRFGRLFAFLGPRQSRDSCRSRGLALLEKFVRSRHKPTWSRPPGKFAALPWCCRSRKHPGCHWFSTSRRSWPLGKGPLSIAGGNATRSPVQTSAPVHVPVPVFAPGSG